MGFCTACGYERNGAAGYCTVCGTAFGESRQEDPWREDPWREDPWRETSAGATRPDLGVGLLDDLLISPEPSLGGWDRYGPPPAQGPRHRSPRRGNWLVVVTVAVVIVAGLGGAAAFELRHGHARASAHASTQAARHSRVSASSSPVRQQNTTPRPSAAPSPSATVVASASGGTRVAVAPGVAGNAALPRVLAFLERYFTAINSHDYQAYASLLDRQVLEQSSPAKFYSGDGSTTDSEATLVGISQTNSGGLAAAITFTSRQQPADSPDQSACDAWSITLYLVADGSGYLLGLPPPGYQASYASC